MPRNSSGVYSPPSGTLAVTGQAISSTAYNSFVADLVSALTASVNTSGTAAMVASLNMGANTIQSVATPVNSTDAANKAYTDALMPSGSVIMFAGSTAPTGFVLCQGQALSRTAEASLFAAIGTAYGSGDGSTTFNVPNFQTFLPVGVGSHSGNTTRNLGDTGGEETHLLVTAEMPSHAHTDSGHTHTDSGHTHPPYGYQFAETNGAGQGLTLGYGETFASATTTGTGAANIQTSTANIQATGGGGAHNNMPPYLAINFIIKT